MSFKKVDRETLKKLYSNECEPCIKELVECDGDQEKAASWNCPKFYGGLFCIEN